MHRNGLETQLRRIGGISAAAIILAAGLGTYAILSRLVPSLPSSSSPAQLIRAPRPAVTLPAAATAVATPSGADPLVAAQIQTERAMKAVASQQLQFYRRQKTLNGAYYRRVGNSPRTPAVLVPISIKPLSASGQNSGGVAPPTPAQGDGSGAGRQGSGTGGSNESGSSGTHKP